MWAKGRGSLCINVYQYGEMNPRGTHFLRDQSTPTDEWQELRCDDNPSEGLLKTAAMALVSGGDRARALIDHAAFVFLESDNPGVELDDPQPARSLRIVVEPRQAQIEIEVAGRKVVITLWHRRNGYARAFRLRGTKGGKSPTRVGDRLAAQSRRHGVMGICSGDDRPFQAAR